MVYCTNCGTKNPDDAKICSKCGKPLYKPSAERYEEETCFGLPYERRRYERDFCFGIPSTIWPLLIGVFIVIWGISILLGISFWWHNLWPMFLILIGLIIIASALFRRR